MMDAIREMEIIRCQVHEQLIDIFNIPVSERVGHLENECFNFPDTKTLPSNSGALQITDMPPKVFQRIMKDFSFKDIAQLRLVSKYFDSNCSFLLNTEFYNLQVIIQQKVQDVKAMMPKRISARKTHPRAHECEVLEILSLRMSLLSMAFDKPIEQRQCCFFPGEIIDEVHNILKYITDVPCVKRSYDITKELYEISNMAFEHLRKCIKPPQTPTASLSTTNPIKPSFITPGSSSRKKTQWLDLESKDIRDILVEPIKDHFEKMKKQVQETDQLAIKNKMEILKMRHSLKTAKLQINSAVQELQEFIMLKKKCQKGLNLLCDSMPDNSIDQNTERALNDSAIQLYPPEAHTKELNLATMNLPAKTKIIQSIVTDHINDNLTAEPPIKKKKY